jgi:nitrite reductase (NADH) small subunit/3-phenylpropionate/trans-cinnamate dioxygenase ferredoxin subunit
MAEFVTVARVGDIPEGEGRSFSAAGRMIAVFNDRGAFRAIDDTCPHAGASLACGTLVEGTVMCAWHGWRFHLCDGAWADYSKLTIGVYQVQVVGEEIQVQVPEPARATGSDAAG